MNYDDERVNLGFRIYIIMIAAFLMIAGLLWHIFNLNQEINIIEQKQQKIDIQTKIINNEKTRSTVIDSLSGSSTRTATKSEKLIKKLPNEKTIISDTVFAAMCDYITNYKPE